MGLKTAEQPRPFWEVWEQGQVVLAEPAVEVPLAHALDGEQQADRDDLAGPKRRLEMLRHVFHGVVYPTEQVDDKVFVGHGGSSRGKSVFGQTVTTVDPAHGPAKKNQHHWFVNRYFPIPKYLDEDGSGESARNWCILSIIATFQHTNLMFDLPESAGPSPTVLNSLSKYPVDAHPC